VPSGRKASVLCRLQLCARACPTAGGARRAAPHQYEPAAQPGGRRQQQRERHGGRLAGARRRLQHQRAAGVQRAQHVAQHLRDGQAAGGVRGRAGPAGDRGRAGGGAPRPRAAGAVRPVLRRPVPARGLSAAADAARSAPGPSSPLSLGACGRAAHRTWQVAAALQAGGCPGRRPPQHWSSKVCCCKGAATQCGRAGGLCLRNARPCTRGASVLGAPAGCLLTGADVHMDCSSSPSLKCMYACLATLVQPKRTPGHGFEEQVTGCTSLNEQRAAELRPERPARHAAWTAARAGRSRWARWCTLARCSQAATASAAPWAAWSTLQARTAGPDMHQRMPRRRHLPVVPLGPHACRLASRAFGAGLGGFAHVPWVNPQARRKLVHPHILALARPAHASDAPSCVLLTAACAHQTWAPMARFCSRGRPSAARALSRCTSSARRDPSAAAALSIIPWRKRGVPCLGSC